MVIPDSEQICYSKLCLFGIRTILSERQSKLNRFRKSSFPPPSTAYIYKGNRAHTRKRAVTLTKQPLFSKNLLWPSPSECQTLIPFPGSGCYTSFRYLAALCIFVYSYEAPYLHPLVCSPVNMSYGNIIIQTSQRTQKRKIFYPYSSDKDSKGQKESYGRKLWQLRRGHLDRMVWERPV